MKLIALEEHFVHAAVAAHYDEVDQALLAPSRVPGLDELGDIRIAAMDEAGIDQGHQESDHARHRVQ